MTELTAKYKDILEQTHQDKIRGMLIAKKLLHKDLINMSIDQLKDFIRTILKKQSARMFGIAQYAYLIMLDKEDKAA